MFSGNFVPFQNVELKDGFWLKRYELNKNVSIASVRNRFEDSGRFDALRFNYLKTGKAPHFYYDSDVAKWIEGVSYIIEKDHEAMKENEDFIDALILDMERAQRDDGYLNSYFQQIEPDKIFTIRGGHELYCLGHLIEAAVAYHNATGKDKLLKIVEKYCDLVEKVFLINKSAAFSTPGHEEIELALFKLYRHTGNEKYRRIAEFFLSMRGKVDTDWPPTAKEGQDDVDIYNLREANGHCVRALYFYSGIADMAYENADERLIESLESVWNDMTMRKMFITGGVGSTRRQESFTVPYDLPNMTSYSESCSAIAFCLLAMRMRKMHESPKFGHLMERELYNNLLSSTSLNGKEFFYENPLEIALEDYGREVAEAPEDREKLAITNRVEVFDCSCCPPNINRWFAMFSECFVYENDSYATVEQYVSSSVKTKHGILSIEESYALDGKAIISSVDYSAGVLKLRQPEWARSATLVLSGKEIATEYDNNGYITVKLPEIFTLEVSFPIAPVFVSANPKVRADAGRIALTYGPVIYCLEGVDNGERLNRISVSPESAKDAKLSADFHGLYSIEVKGLSEKDDDRLYFPASEGEREEITLKFIPYFSFANRGRSDMQVFVRKA